MTLEGLTAVFLLVVGTVGLVFSSIEANRLGFFERRWWRR